MNTTPSFTLRAYFGVIVLLAIASVSRADITTSYSLNLNPGTSAGNPVTNMMIFEANADGSQLAIDYGNGPGGYTINGTGSSILTHTSAFNPAMSLIVGITQQVGKLSMVFFMNDAFAAHATGTNFNPNFFSITHNALISHIQLADAGSQTDRDWFRDSFWPIDETRAAFKTGGSYTAMEFTGGVPIGRSPDASSTLLLLALSCGALLAMARRPLTSRS
jgi:hypothetical protein